MTVIPRHHSRQSGSVLMITLLSGALLTVTLASYLYWVRTQRVLVVQSQAWNSAMALAEAGIEEGLAQINVTFGTNYPPSTQINWGGPTGGVYGPRSNNFNGGSYSAVIIATNTGPTTGPTVVATGTTIVPYLGRPIKRTVQVTTATVAAFNSAVAALLDIEMKGNNIMVDSYDSADPNHSTPTGRYDPATRKAGGDVATTGGLISVQNAQIYGHVYTAPFLAAPSVGANGCVGDLNFNQLGQIQNGWWINDYNQEFVDVTPPFSGGIPPVQNTKGTNTWTLTSQEYVVNGDFTIGSGQTLYIAGTDTKLWVKGNFTMVSQAASFITLAPGANLRLYVGTEAGAPVSTTMTMVNQDGGNAGNFQYYGLPSNTQVKWSGNGCYMGTIYAPEADLYLKGSGDPKVPFDYEGACTIRSVFLDGHFAIHYDENLKRRGPVAGFAVTSWREL